MIRAAQPPAAAKARDTRSPSRRLPRAEKRTRRQQGDTLYHGRLDGRNLAEETVKHTVSSCRRRPAGGPADARSPAPDPPRTHAARAPQRAPRRAHQEWSIANRAHVSWRQLSSVRSQSNARHLQDRDNRGLSLLPGSALLELETSGKGCDLHSSDDARSVTV